MNGWDNIGWARALTLSPTRFSILFLLPRDRDELLSWPTGAGYALHPRGGQTAHGDALDVEVVAFDVGGQTRGADCVGEFVPDDRADVAAVACEQVDRTGVAHLFREPLHPEASKRI